MCVGEGGGGRCRGGGGVGRGHSLFEGMFVDHPFLHVKGWLYVHACQIAIFLLGVEKDNM